MKRCAYCDNILFQKVSSTFVCQKCGDILGKMQGDSDVYIMHKLLFDEDNQKISVKINGIEKTAYLLCITICDEKQVAIYSIAEEGDNGIFASYLFNNPDGSFRFENIAEEDVKIRVGEFIDHISKA